MQPNQTQTLLLGIIAVCLLVLAGFVSREEVENAGRVFLWLCGGFFGLGAILAVRTWRERRELRRAMEAERRNPGIGQRRAGLGGILAGWFLALVGLAMLGLGVGALVGFADGPSPGQMGWGLVVISAGMIAWGAWYIREGGRERAAGVAKGRTARAS